MKKIFILSVLCVSILFISGCKSEKSLLVTVQKTTNYLFLINVEFPVISNQGYQVSASCDHAMSFDQYAYGDFNGNPEWYVDAVSGFIFYSKPNFNGDRARKDTITVVATNLETGETYIETVEITVIPD